MTEFAKRFYRVALLLAGGAILLCSCDGEKKEDGHSQYENLMTEYSENRTIVNTENGQRKYEFSTPLLEGYTAGADPYREFRKGVKIVTYKADSVDAIDVVLTANYAIYYENRKLWEAKGNVVVEKSDGKKLYTEQLFWNAITKKIYSNVDSKIVQPDGEFFVSSFESDEEFRYWSSREMDGRMEVEFQPTEPAEPADSLSAGAAAEKPAAPQSGRSAAAAPERRRDRSQNLRQEPRTPSAAGPDRSGPRYEERRKMPVSQLHPTDLTDRKIREDAPAGGLSVQEPKKQ